MNQAPPASPRPLTAIAGALLGLALILLLRRYAGISHDALLYLGQGLLQREPAIYKNDLFFLHGSQAHYTIFPWLTGWLFGLTSPPHVFLWGGLAWLLLFSAASWHCLRAIFPATQRYWAWLGTITLPTMYGMSKMFSYGEAFLTPRPIAEAFSLLGIGFLARGRLVPAFGLMAIAAMFHPLQAIAATLVAGAWLVLNDRRWLHAAWLGVVPALLSLAGVRPFDDMFRQADVEWSTEVHTFTGQLFLVQWNAADWMALLLDVCILMYAGHILRGAFGRWSLAALMGLIIGFFASFLLVDVLDLVLPAGLQLWRVQWIVHWFAMAAFAVLVCRDLQTGRAARGLLALFVGTLVWTAASWIWIPFALLYAAWPRVFAGSHARLVPLLGWLFGLGIVILFVSFVASEMLWFRIAHHRLDIYAIDRRLLAFPAVALGLPLVGMYAWNKSGPRARLLLCVGLLLPLACFAAAKWDSRPPINRALEEHTFQTGVFGHELPTDARIYWDDDTLVGTWLVLGRASYFNRAQLAGIVFNRETAIDARIRLSRILPLIRESLGCQDRSRPYEERLRCRISDDNLRRACGSGQDRAPDYLVLPYRQAQRPLGTWVIPDPVTGEPAITYFLYRCVDLQADLQRPPLAATGS